MWVIVVNYGSSVDIVGPFHNYNTADRYRIEIYPGMTFGDGTERTAETRPLILPTAKV